MSSRNRVLTASRLAVLALLMLPALGAPCTTWPVYLFLGYSRALPPPADAVPSDEVPTECLGVAPDKLNLAGHRTVRAPDGSTYIADWYYNVILKLSDECGPTTALRVAGNGEEGIATNLPAPATTVPLDGPWGIDVAADGTVYIAEYQFSEGPDPATCDPDCPDGIPWFTAGRILKLDQDGILSEVAEVPTPSQVKVGREGWLYVSSKNLHGHGGIHRIELATSLREEILEEVDAEGIAAYENVSTGERFLYVAVANHALGGPGHWEDAYLCRLELADTGAGCQILLRPEVYQPDQSIVGFPLERVLTGLPTPGEHITDVEVDAGGILHFLYTYKDPGHGIYSDGTMLRKLLWGGYNPAVYRWIATDTFAFRRFGYPMTWDDLTAFYAGCDAAITDGSPGEQVATYGGNAISVAGADGVLLDTQECQFNRGVYDRPPSEITYRTYRTAGVMPKRLFLGADVATFSLESSESPPTTDPYLAEDVVLTGSASFTVDPVSKLLESVQISATYPGQSGGTAEVSLDLARISGFLSGSLTVDDPGAGFSHSNPGPNAHALGESVDGNDIHLEMVSEDIGGGQGTFSVVIDLRDGY